MRFKIDFVADVGYPELVSDRYGYRIGRVCTIDLETLRVGLPLIVNYDNGSYFISSPIQDVKEWYEELIVKTKNRIYTFVLEENMHK